MKVHRAAQTQRPKLTEDNKKQSQDNERLEQGLDVKDEAIHSEKTEQKLGIKAVESKAK